LVGIFFTVLVCCNKENLATLLTTCESPHTCLGGGAVDVASASGTEDPGSNSVRKVTYVNTNTDLIY
jgi:hypothetical protein